MSTNTIVADEENIPAKIYNLMLVDTSKGTFDIKTYKQLWIPSIKITVHIIDISGRDPIQIRRCNESNAGKSCVPYAINPNMYIAEPDTKNVQISKHLSEHLLVLFHNREQIEKLRNINLQDINVGRLNDILVELQNLAYKAEEIEKNLFQALDILLK